MAGEEGNTVEILVISHKFNKFNFKSSLTYTS